MDPIVEVVSLVRVEVVDEEVAVEVASLVRVEVVDEEVAGEVDWLGGSGFVVVAVQVVAMLGQQH